MIYQFDVLFFLANEFSSRILISASSKRPFANEFTLIEFGKLNERTISLAAVCRINLHT